MFVNPGQQMADTPSFVPKDSQQFVRQCIGKGGTFVISSRKTVGMSSHPLGLMPPCTGTLVLANKRILAGQQMADIPYLVPQDTDPFVRQ